MSDVTVARRALSLLDLTDLTDNCSQAAVGRLVTAAKGDAGHGPVAAVCVWPQFVRQAKEGLEGSPVRVATVVNFPGGEQDVERVVEDTKEALGDGADEIDLVLPYKAFLAGDTAMARAMVEAVREVVPQGRLLKVILETGAYPDREAIAAASRLAIECGADFIKTSTGKTAVSATLAAAEAMLEAIRMSDRVVGLKPSGGIRTLADAAAYLALADRMMGASWADVRHFRFGASGLHAALVAAIEGREEEGRAGY
ncbi:deoxyribose-phosphate aldolase [Chelatococcus sp. SYSU_G07232]|uniref:Deoxyribose-phosphate aldolase n=1 Tax=Chelatococcus albus TaxID=3047466 RepID=A0ABT7AE00_9HYPH|nr:deoxyribose-phosphate aldolase [Chelatococcus sp. SYSU_G07232]MDJ1157606.1 deoxyribose-phosphate aldolase [Chelatococcus sp. SYSU_G07232]